MLYVNKLSLNIPQTRKPRIVVVGGGFAGANVVKKIPQDFFQVVLLDRQNYNGFWPLLYQVATAGLEPDSIAEPLRKMFGKGYPDFHFRLVRVTAVNAQKQTLTTTLGDLSYDYLVLATGTKSNYFGNESLREFSFPLKRMRHALNLRSQILQIFEQANMTTDKSLQAGLLNIVIAGGGPTGVELAGALSEMRRHILPRDYPTVDFKRMNIYMVEGQARVLPQMSPASSAKALRYLQQMGILIRLQTRVLGYDGEKVRLNDGSEISSQTLIWAAGVAGIIPEGIPVEGIERGRVLVNDYNQSIVAQNIYAIGDIALMKTKKFPNGHPGVAQPAIQQGRHLGKNFIRMARQLPFKPFNYFDKGTLAIIGRNRAVADLPGNLHVGGVLAWMTWLVVHIYYSIGFRNKMVVISNWIYRFFTYQRGNRLIITPFVHKVDIEGQQFVHHNQEE